MNLLVSLIYNWINGNNWLLKLMENDLSFYYKWWVYEIIWKWFSCCRLKKNFSDDSIILVFEEKW